MSYIGKASQLQGAYDKADDVSTLITGSRTSFPITVGGAARSVAKPTNLVVSITNTFQRPYTDYTISGSDIVFAVAPALPATAQKICITILGDVFTAPSVVATNLDSLTDVVAGSPAVNDILKWNGSNWVNAAQGTYVISNNTDVDTAGAVTGDKLIYNGTTWVPENDNLNNINNVNAAAPTNNQVLTWNAATSKWIAQNPASTVVAINDLSDVDTSVPPNNNQVLTWVAASNQWKPVNTQATITAINGLTDVDTFTTPPSNGQVLTWNSTLSQWMPGNVNAASVNVSLDNLTDVVATAPTDGQALVYNAISHTWIPGTVAGGGGASIINDLGDVDTASVPPTNGQSLVWNSVTSRWRPLTITGGGGGALDDLSDVDLTVPPTNGQALVYNSVAGQWLAGSVAGSETIPTNVDIYCSSSGSDTTGDGSVGLPYATIAKAGQIAAVSKATNRIVIHLADGEGFYGGATLSNTFGCIIELRGNPADRPSLIWATDMVSSLNMFGGKFIFTGIQCLTLTDQNLFYFNADRCSYLYFDQCEFGYTDVDVNNGRMILSADKCGLVEFSGCNAFDSGEFSPNAIYVTNTDKLIISGGTLNKKFGKTGKFSAILNIKAVSYVYLYNIEFNYNGPWNSGETKHIYAVDCPNIIIESEGGFYFYNCDGQSIYLDNSHCRSYCNIYFSNCFISIFANNGSSFICRNLLNDGGTVNDIRDTGALYPCNTPVYSFYAFNNSSIDVYAISSQNYSSTFPGAGCLYNNSKMLVETDSSGEFGDPINPITTNGSGPISYSNSLSYFFIPSFTAAGG